MGTKLDLFVLFTLIGMSIEEKIKFTGFPAGVYVRLEFSGIPVEFVKNFRPSSPILVGGMIHAC